MFIQYDSHFNKMQRYSTRHASQEDVNFCVENNAVERNTIHVRNHNDIDILSCEIKNSITDYWGEEEIKCYEEEEKSRRYFINIYITLLVLNSEC